MKVLHIASATSAAGPGYTVARIGDVVCMPVSWNAVDKIQKKVANQVSGLFFDVVATVRGESR